MRAHRRFIGSTTAVGLGLSLLTLAPASASANPAPTPAPRSASETPGFVVGVGDSYMSGEGGVWSNRGYPTAEPSPTWSHWSTGAPDPAGAGFYSGFVYGAAGDYQTANAPEAIPFAHQSAWSAARTVGDYDSFLTAVSGATTTSFTEQSSGVTVYKPGVSFEPAGPYPGQAAVLQDFASENDVDVVTLSIGGNDFGFAPLATSCVVDYLIPFIRRYCSEQKSNLELITPEAMDVLKEKIKGAVANVVTAMRNAGNPDGSWRLHYQLPPMPIAPADKIPFPDTGNYSRQNIGGCGMYNKDIEWIHSTVFPRLTNAMTQAIAESRGTLNGTPVVVLNNTNAFDGHRLCESPAVTQAVSYPGGVAPAVPGDAATIAKWGPNNGAGTEWITPIIFKQGLPIRKDPHLTQNALHPNYWGQRALSACHDAALEAPANSVISCEQVPGDPQLDAKGRPAMYAAQTTEIAFTQPNEPTITAVGSANQQLDVAYTAPTKPGASPISGYEYTTEPERIPFGDATWVPVTGGATPPNPFQLSVDSAGAALANGTTYQVALRALNDAGAGLSSNVVQGVPAPRPASPVITSVTPLDYAARVVFTPGETGGVPVDRYEYRVLAPASEVTDWATVDGQVESPITIGGLRAEVDYVMELRAQTVGGSSDPAPFTVTPGPEGSKFIAIDPVRILDTRNTTALRPGETRSISTLPTIPAEADSLWFNVTVTGTQASGYLEITPTAEVSSRQASTTSVINWAGPLQTIANGYTVRIGVDGQLDLTLGSSGSAEVVIDAMGYTVPTPSLSPQAEASVFTPVEPIRVVDTRVDGGRIFGGESRLIDVRERLGAVFPQGASAVAFNLTITGTRGSGYLALTDGEALRAPDTSTVNWSGWQTTLANSSVVKLDNDGELKVFAEGGSTEYVVDVVGFFGPQSVLPDGAEYFPVNPTRVYDSRISGGPLYSGAPRRTSMNARGNVPPDAVATAFNATITGNTSSGFLGVAPAGDEEMPNASLLNWSSPGTTRANGSVVGISADEVATYVGGSGSTNYIIDLGGYFR